MCWNANRSVSKAGCVHNRLHRHRLGFFSHFFFSFIEKKWRDSQSCRASYPWRLGTRKSQKNVPYTEFMDLHLWKSSRIENDIYVVAMYMMDDRFKCCLSSKYCSFNEWNKNSFHLSILFCVNQINLHYIQNQFGFASHIRWKRLKLFRFFLWFKIHFFYPYLSLPFFFLSVSPSHCLSVSLVLF